MILTSTMCVSKMSQCWRIIYIEIMRFIANLTTEKGYETSPDYCEKYTIRRAKHDKKWSFVVGYL